jgi:succinate dehydrogenase / fumarate reductase, flavoprotein subunit
MMDNVSVVRDQDGLVAARDEIQSLKRTYQHVSVRDPGKVFNTDLMETLELGYMLDCAESIVEGALAREESRGAHYRSDFEKRDDVNWLAHTMVSKTSGGLQIRKKPVKITVFEPKVRTY